MSDVADILVPALGESVSEGTLGSWRVAAGDAVAAEQSLVEIETDKAAVEIYSPHAGVVAEILAEEGADVAPGAVIARIALGADAAATVTVKTETATAPTKTETKTTTTAPSVSSPTKTETMTAPPPVSAPSPAPEKTETVTMTAAPAPVVSAVSDPAETGGALDPSLVERGGSRGGISTRDLQRFLHRQSVETETATTETTKTTTTPPPVSSPASETTISSATTETTTTAAPVSSPAPEATNKGAADATPTSPSVERLLQENNLRPETVKASGPGGRILKGDILALLKGETPAVAAAAASDASVSDAVAESVFVARREKMPRMRRAIARRLKEAQNTAAMLTTYNEVDMTRVVELRASYKDAIQERFGVRLGFMGFFVKAVAVALEELPVVGARIEGEEMVYPDGAHIGVAVATPKGLVAPVLRHAESRTLLDLESELGALAVRAREGGLEQGELEGGGITISNGGVFGSLLSSPILNFPQSAILGLHAIQERAVVRDGEIVVRRMMYLALSYDHRLIDGREAVTFLVKIRDAVESPETLLLAS
ncbi:MAG: dihydrolipoyllysine-residue succinyltransferase [Alphaproteobacteria bacterium]|nr:dihydrolipoyllysine-residue succinyltransferase [Alphaproteobacteria bacterium]